MPDSAPDHVTAAVHDQPESPPKTAKEADGADASKPVTKPKTATKSVHPDETTRRLQVGLLARGMYTGNITGTDSPATRLAVKHFQAILGHPTTGRITPDELKQLGG